MLQKEQEPLPYLFPPLSSLLLTNQFFNAGDVSLTSGDGDVDSGVFDTSRFLFLLPSLLLFQGGSMDLSKVGEKILSSVRSARSLGVLPPSDRPEVPERAAVAAAVARALAGLPPHQRYSLPLSSEELKSIYGSSRPQGEVVEELEDVFYEEDFDPIRHVLENLPSEENELPYFEKQAALRIAQLDRVTERLSLHVMENHEVMGDEFGTGIGEGFDDCKYPLHEWEKTHNFINEGSFKGPRCKFQLQKETSSPGHASTIS